MFRTSKMSVEEIREKSERHLAKKTKVPVEFVGFAIFCGPIAVTNNDKTRLIDWTVERKKPSTIRQFIGREEQHECYTQCPMCGQGIVLLDENHVNNHGNRLPVHKNDKGKYCVSPKNFAVIDCPMPAVNEPPPELPPEIPPETDFIFIE